MLFTFHELKVEIFEGKVYQWKDGNCWEEVTVPTQYVLFLEILKEYDLLKMCAWDSRARDFVRPQPCVSLINWINLEDGGKIKPDGVDTFKHVDKDGNETTERMSEYTNRHCQLYFHPACCDHADDLRSEEEVEYVEPIVAGLSGLFITRTSRGATPSSSRGGSEGSVAAHSQLVILKRIVDTLDKLVVKHFETRAI